MIGDISRGGCRFKMKYRDGSEVDQLKIGKEIVLYFPLMGIEGARELKGKIRNTNLDSSGISIGIQYEELDPEISEMIQSYVKTVREYRDMVKSSRSA